MEWNYKCNLIFPIETKTAVNITFTAVFLLFVIDYSIIILLLRSQRPVHLLHHHLHFAEHQPAG